MNVDTLPTGTVTFLFTDIEGSTKLLQRLGETYTSVLADQRHILRTSFERWNGQEVDTQGDAFFVAFQRASDAVQATVDAQRSSFSHKWPDGEVVRIRMGLHTGQPQVAPTGYVGMDVHRAARIAHVAHGGQVLLSETTFALVRDDLPEGISSLNLGQHRLKDMGRPEQLYQLVIPDLLSDYPPLKSLDAHPNNLPIQPTPLVGRQAELTTIKDLIGKSEVRLLTLTGPGGTGKTRLALQLAAETLVEFPDGAYLILLDFLSEADLVAPTIARTLGVREVGQRSILDTLINDLQDKVILLLLDNFEQLVDAAPLIAELLAGISKLRVIITSRQPLHLRGEYEYPVPPLAIPDITDGEYMEHILQNPAVALFTQRAQTVKPTFQITSGNAKTVIEICRILDGLPLAIELAAARIKLLSPEALLKRLVDSDRVSTFKLLSGGKRDAPDRHQTLMSTMNCSYQLLEPEEARLFRWLGVFSGGFELPAAEAIVQPETNSLEYTENNSKLDLFDGLALLTDKSLLRLEESGTSEPRFTMLGTIREFALEQLKVNHEVENLRFRHASYYTNLAREAEKHLEKPDQADWLDRLENENANLRSVLRWSIETKKVQLGLELGVSLSLYWLMRGFLTEGREWFDGLLGITDVDINLQLYARALERAGFMARYQGDYTHATRLTSQGLDIWRQLDDQKGIADSLTNLGFVTLHQGDYEQAIKLYREALFINRMLSNDQGIADALSHLALIAYYRGDYQQAQSMDQESLEIWEVLGDQQGIAWAKHKLGNDLLLQDKLHKAQELFKDSLKISTEIGYKWGIAYSLEGLASCAALGNQAKRAIILASGADRLRHNIGMPLSEASLGIYNETLQPARQIMSEEEIKHLSVRASLMDLDQVCRLALENYSFEEVI